MNVAKTDAKRSEAAFSLRNYAICGCTFTFAITFHFILEVNFDTCRENGERAKSYFGCHAAAVKYVLTKKLYI